MILLTKQQALPRRHPERSCSVVLYFTKGGEIEGEQNGLCFPDFIFSGPAFHTVWGWPLEVSRISVGRGWGTAGLMETESICEGAYIGELGQLAKRLASYCSMGTSIPRGFPGGAIGKESACNAGDSRDMGSIPGSGSSLGGGNKWQPLQYSCLEKNLTDRGAWWTTTRGVAKSQTRLSS